MNRNYHEYLRFKARTGLFSAPKSWTTMLLRPWGLASFKPMVIAWESSSLIVWKPCSRPIPPIPMPSSTSAVSSSHIFWTVVFHDRCSIVMRHLIWRSGRTRTSSRVSRQRWKRTKRHTRCYFPFLATMASFNFRGSKVLDKSDRNPMWNTQVRQIPLLAKSWSNPTV